MQNYAPHPTLLQGKKVVVAVSGSIAIYKSLEFIRLLIKSGASVRVVMSASAVKFIAPLTFETVSQNRVLDDENESWADDHNHIGFAKWADLLIIAPATANTIAKLANAIADNILLQVALAFGGKKLLAPAANTTMLENPITQANLKMLGIANYEIISSQTKLLACRDVGNGAMAEPLELYFQSARALLSSEFWRDRRVIVTGGGTIEKIDDVRYLSNFSSGKMASALASALYLRGADVNLIATRFSPYLPASMHTIDVESSSEMLEYLSDSIRVAKKGKLSKPTLMSDEPIRLIQKKPFLFMAAAVSDYTPQFAQSGKLKKSLLGKEWQLSLKQNADLLSSIDKDGIATVAFKAEMDPDGAMQNAKDLLDLKCVDAVCLNLLDGSKSFGSDDNAIEFITKSGTKSLPRADKLSLSLDLLDLASELAE